MNKTNKILTIIFCVVVAIALIIIALNKIDKNNKDKVFSIENPDKINKIFLADKGNHTVLLEKKGALWIVNNQYYAVDELVRNMLMVVKRLQIREPVSQSAHNNTITLLATGSTKVELYGDGYAINFLGIKLFPRQTLVNSFYVGTSTKDNLGTYMIKENSNRPYVVYIPGYRGSVSPYFSTDINSWRAHFIFNYRIPQVTSYQYVDNEHPEESYTITNIDSRHFNINTYPDNKQIKAFDTTKVVDLMSSFANLRYEWVVNDNALKPQVDSIIKTTPAHVLTLTDKNGIQTFVKTYRIPLQNVNPKEYPNDWFDKDRLYAFIKVPSPFKDENGNTKYDEDFVIVQYFTFDTILRSLSMLVNQ